MRTAAFCLILLLSAGCASGDIPAPFTKPADTIMLQRGGAIKTYIGLSITYITIKFRIEQACAAKKLDSEWCKHELPRIDNEVQRIHKRAVDTLANPTTEVDWQAIYEVIEVIVKLAGAAL